MKPIFSGIYREGIVNYPFKKKRLTIDPGEADKTASGQSKRARLDPGTDTGMTA